MPHLVGGSAVKENIGTLANVRAESGAARYLGKEPVTGAEPASAKATQAASLQLCGPHIAQILGYLLQAERAPRPYFDSQPHINAHMRGVLVDWLVDVAQKFAFGAQAVFLAVDLLDAFLATYAPARPRLQLVGVACLLIVGKYEEVYPPPLADYIAVCDGAYTREELLEMEAAVLLGVGFELNRPTALTFLDCAQAVAPLARRPLQYCQYLLESALVDAARLRHPNRELAAGALLLVAKLFAGRGGAEQLLNVPLARAKTCAKELYLVMQRNEAARLTAVKRKFAAEALGAVARFRIEKVAHD